ncbi:Imm52 family immunity protein [Hyalangium sp.]|uniref:Imm52 family immunity protein n=1 Tax=Hyalangium sp. TaxID=2028555 RepID=UPI002D2D31E9|nr:Imm52 family immunity protein [Hyalangium sp.]HYH94734.1 Imm52 family immunity protein [Hyalangium sp.]
MIETYYAGAYWGARKESAEECARRAQTFFDIMARHGPHLAHWFKPPHSRKQASVPLPLDAPTLRELFSQGSTRNDEGSPIEDLGFRIFADSGQWPDTPPRELASLTVKCGGHADSMGPNASVLNLPSAGDPLEQLVSAPMLANILRAMVLAWEPERGLATSHAHRELVSERAKVGTFVGWVMYFPHHLGPVPPLPPPVHVEPLVDKGSLVILTPERFTASNPEHVALAARVHETLSQAGLMNPLS